jgi:hypothetical protein
VFGSVDSNTANGAKNAVNGINLSANENGGFFCGNCVFGMQKKTNKYSFLFVTY